MGGGWVEGEVKTLLLEKSRKKKLSAGGKGVSVEGRVKTLLPGGTTKNFTAGAMGVGVWEKVWRFWHRHVAPQQKYNIKGREGNTENKIKTSKQSRCCLLATRWSLYRILYLQQNKCDTPSKAGEAQCPLYAVKTLISKAQGTPLPRKI